MKKLIRGIATVLCATAALAHTGARAIEVTFEEDRSLPVVYLNLAVKAGSAADPNGQTGITSFVAKMLLRGTQTRNKEQIDLALDQMGARLEVETRAEALILRGAVLKTELDNFLSLLTEIVTAPSFPENEIDKLKRETVSQIKEELGSDSALANRKFTRFLFRDHPYGKPALGTTKEVTALKRAQLMTQYLRLFQDPLLLVVGTGDASSSRIDDWARALATRQSQVKPPAGTPSVEMAPATSNAAQRRLLLVDKPDRTQSQVLLGQIGVRMTDKDFFPLHVGNHIFGGGGFQSRLMQEIRVKRGWTYGAYSYYRHGLRPRSWQIGMATTAKDTAPALEYVIKMLGDLREKGVTPEEFDFSREVLINGVGFMYNTPKKRVENTLLERTLDLPKDFMKSYAGEISKVQLSDVNAALSRYLKPEQLSILVLSTMKDMKQDLVRASGVRPSEVQVVPYTQE